MTQVLKSAIAITVLSLAAVGCGEKSQSPAATPAAVAVVTPMSGILHKPNECPSPGEISGRWIGFVGYQAPSPVKRFRFDSSRIVESTMEGDVVYDGATHELVINPTLRRIYAGGCDKGRLIVKSEYHAPNYTVVETSKMSFDGDRLIVRTDIIQNGVSVREREDFRRERRSRRRY